MRDLVEAAFRAWVYITAGACLGMLMAMWYSGACGSHPMMGMAPALFVFLVVIALLYCTLLIRRPHE